jgi:hypothetical protein
LRAEIGRLCLQLGQRTPNFPQGGFSLPSHAMVLCPVQRILQN